MDAIVKKIQRWYFKFQVVTLIVEMDPAEKVGTYTVFSILLCLMLYTTLVYLPRFITHCLSFLPM